MNNKTYTAKPADIDRRWLLVDAKDIPIGRLATKVASILRGKHKPIFTPHVDTGDVVVIVNAEQIKATGNKENDKMYHSHTGYPGGIKSINLADLRATHPERIIKFAVKRMLPRGPLGREMFKKLHVYAGGEHPHQAQQPEQIQVA